MTTTSSGPKLSKAFFMGLADGVYLTSNVGDRFRPAFAEQVSASDQREEQWQRIKEARVDQQLCIVCMNKKDFDTWLKKRGPSTDKQ